MKSREPVLVHGRDEWDRVSLPPAEFRRRVDAIRAGMADEGVDALFVYGRGDRDGDLAYVSNLVNKVPNWGLLVVLTADSVLVRNERSSRTRPVVERATWIEEVDFCANVVEGVADLLPDGAGPDAGTVATAGFDRLPHRQRATFDDELAAAGVADVVAFDDRLAALRADKSRRERDQVARSARILADVQSLVASTAAPVTEAALASDADRRARLRGVQDVRVLVGNPAATEPHLRPAEGHAIRPADPVVVYTAARYEGYWAESARTIRLDGEPAYGPASDAVADVYDDFLDAIRPGRTVGAVLADLDTLVAGTDLAVAPEYDPLHGIGLAADEAPLPSATDHELSAGETLSVRLAAHPDGDADALVVHNDTVAVTDDGVAVLTGDRA